MRNLLIIFLCTISHIAFSQGHPAGHSGQPRRGGNGPSKIVFGRVVDAQTNKGMEYVTVFLVDKNTHKNITGATTKAQGRFMIPYQNPNFYIKIKFMGYLEKTIQQYKVVGGRINLGTIKLEQDMVMVEGAEIEGEVSETVFELDKKVFNVGKDLSTTGAGALEVLDNVPSVNVTVDGNVTLRGGEGVQILIDGKPSIMTESSTGLGSITADMIEKIEVITNPSAKFQAEGTTGIINIVLKKEEKKGTNGSLSLNLGYPLSNSIGFSINHRTKKWNLFSQMGAGRRVLPKIREANNHNLVTDTQVLSDEDGSRNENFYNISLGTDYHIDKNNVLTLSGSYALEDEDEGYEMNYRILNSDVLAQQWKREENTESINPKWQYDLKYHKDFERHKDQDLALSFSGRSFAKDKGSIYEENNIIGVRALNNQNNRTDFRMSNYNLKADYTHPFTEKIKVETGAMYVIDKISNDFEVANIIDGRKVVNSGLSNVFDFDQNVLGLYGTFAYKADKWGIKGGLRLERTDVKTYLHNTSEENTQNYQNLFPSMHISYKLSQSISFQAGYSKRIYRPRLWALNPFYSIRNNFSYYTGNPKLEPEFTDSYEFSTIFDYEKVSISTSLYHGYVYNEQNRITDFEGNTSIVTFYNLGTSNFTGIEANIEYQPNRKVTLTSDINLMQNQNNFEYDGQNLDFEAFNWTMRAKAKIKLPKDYALELSGNYRSRRELAQGEDQEVLFANLGLRKKIMKGKIVTSLSVRDIFASRYDRTSVDQPTFKSYRSDTRGRFVRFGISYSFGKGEAMQYSGRGYRR